MIDIWHKYVFDFVIGCWSLILVDSCHMLTDIPRGTFPFYYQYSWCPLQWRHNRRDGVWKHQHRDCLLNRLFRRRSEKTSKLRVTGLCAGNSPVTGEFPTQMASNAENVSISWRHHAVKKHWTLLVKSQQMLTLFENANIASIMKFYWQGCVSRPSS